MYQFSLSITDIQIKQTNCVRETYVLKNYKTGVFGVMAVAIAGYCDVTVWSNTGFRYGKRKIQPAKLNFFGLESDVAIAMFIMDIVINALTREVVIFKRTSWWKNNIINLKEIKSRSASAGFKKRVCIQNL